MNFNRVLEAFDYAIENGGATFNEKGLATEKKGYFVSLKDKGVELPFRTFTKSDLAEYCSEHLSTIQAMQNAYIGLWLDGATWYLDLSLHIQDIGTAVMMGVRSQQKAIWDIEKEKEINLSNLG